jgi:hypothetical protein
MGVRTLEKADKVRGRKRECQIVLQVKLTRDGWFLAPPESARFVAHVVVLKRTTRQALGAFGPTGRIVTG